MKATGIVRRIDDLGRVVIPKEIRRTMRIREGDPLEIYTGANEEVVFKKYSPIGELSEQASVFAEAAAGVSRLGIVITDRDHCISAAGVSKKDIIDKEVSRDLGSIMENRQPFISNAIEQKPRLSDDTVTEILAAYPIISAGDLCGAVVLVPSATQNNITESDLNVAQLGASFLGRQLED